MNTTEYKTASERVTFDFFEAYEDGSGAAATMRAGGMIFGAVWTMGASVSLRDGQSMQFYGNRARRMRDYNAKLAHEAFVARIHAMGPEWMAKCDAFYGRDPEEV